MRRKFFFLILLLLLPLVASADAVEIGGIYYNLDSETKTAEVTQNSNKYAGDVVIPKSVVSDGITYNVTWIGRSAFKGCSGLTSITIPNSVKSISIGAFSGCSGLTTIDVETGNAYYNSYNNCNAIIETISNTLITGCNNTIIPNFVTSIGIEAFSGCTGLTSITIPNSVTSIGSYAFSYCSSLTSIIIPNSVTSVGWGAFRGCTGLISITLPNSVTSIGKEAFSGCSSLTSMTIPNSVTSIGDYAFDECSSLTSITIPNSVKSIGACAFQGCCSLTDVTIPNFVASIGMGAFTGCSGLTSVMIPNSVTIIETGTFGGCSGLTSIIIPNSVTSIGRYAFENCTSLTSITIPNSVTSIGNRAFARCISLTSVTVSNSEPLTIEEYTFSNRVNATLYVPKGSKAAYEAADYWKEFKEIIELEPENIPKVTFDFTLADANDSNASLWGFPASSANKLVEEKSFTYGGYTIKVAGSEGQGYYWHIKDHYLIFGKQGAKLTLPAFDFDVERIEIEGNSTASSGTKQNIYVGETAVSTETVGANGINIFDIAADYQAAGNVYVIKVNSNHNNQIRTIKIWKKGTSEIIIPKAANIAAFTALGAGTEAVLKLDGAKVTYVSPDGKSVYVRDATGGMCFYSQDAFAEASNKWVLGGSVTGKVNIRNNMTYMNITDATALTHTEGAEYAPVAVTMSELSNHVADLIQLTEDFTVTDVSGKFYNNENKDVQLYDNFKLGYTVNAGDVLKNLTGVVVMYNIQMQVAPTVTPSIESETPSEPIATTEEVLKVEGVTANKEQTVSVDICLDNKKTALTAYQFDLTLPAGITLVKNNKDKFQVTKTDRYEDESQSLSVSLLEENTYRIVSFSLSNGIIEGTSGAILNAVLAIDGNVADGTYEAQIANIIFTQADGKQLKLADAKFDIVVNSIVEGDANGDGEINVSDIVEIVNYIMDKPSAGFVLAAADLNGDGEVNVTDIVMVVNIIMAGNGSGSRGIEGKADGLTDNDFLTLIDNEDGRMSLSLDNQGSYVASQFDLRLSDGQVLKDIKLNGNRMAGHQVAYTQIGEGLYRVIVYSLSNEEFNDQTGELLNFDIAGSGTVSVENILFITAGQAEKRFASLQSTTTGIMAMKALPSDNGLWFDLQGRRVTESAKKGVYINKGKKLVVR